jgi:hypothetical protein
MALFQVSEILFFTLCLVNQLEGGRGLACEVPRVWTFEASSPIGLDSRLVKNQPRQS